MKHTIHLSIAVCVLLLFSIQSFAQGNTCLDVAPFCTDSGVTFPAGVNVPQAEVTEPGNDYGCLGSTPNPAWYYLEIETPGDINILQTNSNSVDVDFILWGPFPNANAANDACGTLNASQIEDCSYSAAAIENIDITGAITGQVYILLITNFSNQPTNITAGQTGGAGATDCDIVLCDLQATATANNPVCSGNTIQLTGGVSSSGNTVTYAWTGPNGYTSTLQTPTIPNATPANSGDYTLEVTVDECTSEAATVNVPVIEYTLSASNSTPNCVGGIVAFSAIPTPTTLTGATYTWAGPNGFTSTEQTPAIFDLSLANSGTYTVSVTAGGCPVQTASTTLTVTQPKAVATSNSPVCIGGTLQLNANMTPADAGATYTWTGPDGFTSNIGNSSVTNFSPSKAGSYFLNGNSNGCIAETDTVVVTSFSISATAAQVGSTCSDASTGQALAQAPSATAPLSFVWSTGATDATATDLAAGSYTVTVTDANNCYTTTTVTVSNFPAPTVTIGGKLDFCEGQTANLNAGNFVNFLWSTGETTQSITPSIANTYTVTITDINGCTATNQANVIQNSVVAPSITGNLLVLPKNGTVLDAGSGYIGYAWSNGTLTQTNSVSEGGIYNVTVTDPNNCLSTNSVEVTKLNVAIPNAFSPNGDGANDIFRLNFPPEYVTAFELNIFDRWGQKLFTTTNLNEGWDGTNKNIDSPIDVYAYYLKITFNDAIEETYRGNVTLIR